LEGGLERDLELALEALRLELAEAGGHRRGARLDHPGGVDEDVERAERLLRRGDELERLGAVGEVGDVRGDAVALVSQLRGADLDSLGRR
jgi:hypothetical protein